MGRPKKNPESEAQSGGVVPELEIAPFEAWYNEKTDHTIVALLTEDNKTLMIDADLFAKLATAAGWERLYGHE
jgi:hypothetical protein